MKGGIVQVVVSAVSKITQGGGMLLKMAWGNALEKSGAQVGEWF
jgi:hypothetical protein